MRHWREGEVGANVGPAGICTGRAEIVLIQVPGVLIPLPSVVLSTWPAHLQVDRRSCGVEGRHRAAADAFLLKRPEIVTNDDAGARGPAVRASVTVPEAGRPSAANRSAPTPKW